MPWCVSWFDEQETTILLKLSEAWSWKDFEAASAHVQALFSCKPYTVHLICDLTEWCDPPDNRILTPFMRVYAKRSTDSGFKIIVGATQFVQIAISVLTNVMGGASAFRYADTVEEAAALLTRIPMKHQI